MNRINIDRINLRLRGVSPQVARSAMPGLRHQIQQQLLRQEVFHQAGRGSDRNINQISPDPIQIRTDVHAAELNRKIAQAIANSIAQDRK